MKSLLLYLTSLLCVSLFAQTGISTPTYHTDTARYTWEGEIKNNMRQGVWTGTNPNKHEITCVYADGKLNGKWLARWSGGSRREEGMYVNNLRDGKWIIFYSQDDTNMVVHYKMGVLDGEYKYFDRKKVTRQGTFVNGKKEGKWTATSYTLSKQLHARTVYTYSADVLNGPTVVYTYSGIRTANYEAGKVISRDSTLAIDTSFANKPWPPPYENEPLAFAEEMPHFKGGEAAFQTYLQDSIVYPKSAVDGNKEGTVYVSFVIAPDGSVADAYVVKGIPNAPELNAEALRVIENMPKWSPGRMNGKAVAVQMTVPIKFVLENSRRRKK